MGNDKRYVAGFLNSRGDFCEGFRTATDGFATSPHCCFPARHQAEMAAKRNTGDRPAVLDAGTGEVSVLSRT